MHGYNGSYSQTNESNKPGTSGRYSHIPTDQKDKILVDSQRHDLNVERRIFEREGMFNMDTRNVESSNFYKTKSHEDSKKFGEITGEIFHASDLEQGMPMRDFMVNERELLGRTETHNQYLDFDIYGKKLSDEPISYHDPHQNQNGSMNDKTFSEINESKTLLQNTKKDTHVNTFTNITNSNSLLLFNGIRSSVNKESKIIMSPLGTLLSLMLLYVGSSNDTTLELKEFLNLPEKNVVHDMGRNIRKIIKDSGFIIQHNIVYIPSDIPLNSAFQQYISELGAVDVLNTNQLNNEYNRINGIINNLTNGTINNVLGTKTLGYNTRIMCVNTIIVKPKWVSPFSKQHTKKAQFNSFESRNIDMMVQTNVKRLYTEDSVYQLIELDLQNQFMMGFFISKQNTVPTVQYDQLTHYWKQLKEVGLNTVQIPKFKYQCRYKIDSLLKKLGLINLFLDGTFDNMCTSANGINVTDIVHHAVVSVDEGGISHKEKNNINGSMYSTNFIANKPFLFYIRHYPTNTLVTIGIYT